MLTFDGRKMLSRNGSSMTYSSLVQFETKKSTRGKLVESGKLGNSRPNQ